MWAPQETLTWIDSSRTNLTIRTSTDGRKYLEKDTAPSGTFVGQTDPLRQPEIVEGVLAKPLFKFTGSEMLSGVLDSLGVGEVTVSMLVQIDGFSGYGVVLNIGNSSIMKNTGSSNLRIVDSFYGTDTTFERNHGDWLIFTLTAAKNGVKRMSLNGNPFIENLNGTTDLSEFVTIGGKGDLTRFLRGHVAEIIVEKGTVTDQGQFDRQGYLATKWNKFDLLPLSHPYKNPVNEDQISAFLVSNSLSNYMLIPQRYGAIGDGQSHPVQEWIDYGKYKSLSEIQKDYPHVTSLNDQIDWAAIQKCLSNPTGKIHSTITFMPEGYYMVNKKLYVKHYTALHGFTRGNTRLIATPDFPAETPVVQIGKLHEHYHHANFVKGLTIDCAGNADYGIVIYNCNEHGGAWDWDIGDFRKHGIVIDGSTGMAINFILRDGGGGTSYATIDDPAIIDIRQFHHPLRISNITATIRHTNNKPFSAGIRTIAGGYSLLHIADCHFEHVKYGIDAKNGRVHIENCDAQSVIALANFEGGVEGTCRSLFVRSSDGSKAVRDASGPFQSSPITFGNWSYGKIYSAGRRKGFGAITNVRTDSSTDQTGVATIQHRMPAAPEVVIPSIIGPDNNETLMVRVKSITDTEVTLFVWDATGTPKASTVLTFNLMLEM